MAGNRVAHARANVAPRKERLSMRKAMCGLAILAVASWVAVVPAAELEPGSVELGGTATWSDTDDIGSAVNVDLMLGWLFGSRHEIGPLVSYSSFDAEEGGGPDETVSDLFENDQGFIGPLYLYNFSGGGSLVPFVGGQVQLPIGDIDDAIDWTAGVRGGVRSMVTNSASINFTAFYNRFFTGDDLDDLTGTSGGDVDVIDDLDNWGVSIGVSIFFGTSD
jgi:hypothetical protein